MSDIKVVRVRVFADEERAANKGKCTARTVIVKCDFDRNNPPERSFESYLDAFLYSQYDMSGRRTLCFTVNGVVVSRAELCVNVLNSSQIVPDYICGLFGVERGATYGDSARRQLKKISGQS